MIAHLEFSYVVFFFFFNDTATTEIYTLSLHDALPIWQDDPMPEAGLRRRRRRSCRGSREAAVDDVLFVDRSEEHTSELQSH